MPEPTITREEAREWLQREMETNERGRDTARELGLGTTALYGRAAARCRVALAALEDAERVEWMQRTVPTGEFRERIEPLILPHDEDLSGDWLRIAIDRARGGTPTEPTP